jgi:beta-galactosidase
MTINQEELRLESGAISPRLAHIFYGGDYNPEQWPEEVWQEDVELMQQAGVNIVTLGVFSWSKLEPRPGQFDFGWFDRIMNLLDKHGVKVDLATATASPPPWLAKLHPESLPVTRSGVKLWPGSRQQYCPSSPAYRERVANLVRALASRYKDHPALTLWHINNEYGCHVAECYCDISAQAFRVWLQNRYGTLEELNHAWGTAFWSQQYSEWDEINPPRSAPTFINPTMQLDFKRFSSDELLECFKLEKKILREITPDIPVTTNFMNFFKPMNYWEWAKHQDIISNDTYPDPTDPASKIEMAMGSDLMRSLGGGKPWLLMEQTTSQVNWRSQNALKRPGQMRLLSYQAVARGANGTLFFQWRASKAGAEKFHGALVQHVDLEHSRVWQEVSRLGGELKRYDPLLNTEVKPQIGIVLDWNNWWALELDAHPSSDVKQLEQIKTYYTPLWNKNIPVDFVSPESDLSKYKVLLVPNLYLVTDEFAARINEFVENGGRLVMSFFSGIVDQNDHIRLGGYPASFREMLGLRVEEFDPYAAGQTNRLKTAEGSFSCDLWSDIINLEGAEALATFESDFYAGKAAVTCHQYGQGISYYLGTRPEAAYMEHLLSQICDEAGITTPFSTPAGVELVRRENDERAYLFLLNHNGTPVEIEVGNGKRDLITGQVSNGTIKLGAYGAAVLEESKKF